jgi:peptide/nickel transport system substrate-binding protein
MRQTSIVVRTGRWCLAVAVAAVVAASGAVVAAQAPVRGGTAVIAITADPGHLNPGITTAANVHVVADSLFNGLVRLDRESSPVPDLATRWTVSADSTVYTFYLAPGVRWHDGTPMTSADVRFTFEEVLFKYHARTRAGLGNIVSAIETPDEGTVVFRLRQPYGALLQALDVTEAPILPRHIFEVGDPNTNPANIRPIGTGPFRLESYNTGDSVTLVRNAEYFKPNLPYLDRLVFRIIPDTNTQVLALLRGEVDYVERVGEANVERLQGRAGITLENVTTGAGGGNCIMTLTYNLERPRLADLRVRQALAHAIDREQILHLVIFDQGRVAAAPISSGIRWAHAPGLLARYEHSPARSTALLDEAGAHPGADGNRFALDIVYFPNFNKYGEVMRQNLARVGIRLNLRPLDRAATVDAIFTRRDFDIGLISYCNGADPEIGVRRMYVSSNIGNVPFSNGSAYRNSRIDALFAAGGATAGIEERTRIYREIQSIAAEELPYWWLVETDGASAHRDNFRGFEPWSGQFAERAWRGS